MAGPVAGTGNNTPGNPAANLIGGNLDDGVDIVSGSCNRVSMNRIFANDEMGINLGATDTIVAPAANAQSGPNNLQNYPVLTSVASAGGTTTILGTLIPTSGNGSYWIEFYANSQLSADGGLSEGQWFLGDQQFSIGSDGLVDIDFTVTTPAGNSTGPYGASGPVLDHLITAIAIDGNGNTSEFSAARNVLRNAVAYASAAATVPINIQIPQAYKAAAAVYESEVNNRKDPVPTSIVAIFQPDKILGVEPTIAQAAQVCGVDHFNWLQYITYKPVAYHILVPNPSGTVKIRIGSGTQVYLYSDTGTVVPYPLLDPIENYPQQVYGIYSGSTLVGTVNPGVPTTDDLPYYYDDKPDQNDAIGYETQTDLSGESGGNWLAGKMFAFYDGPSMLPGQSLSTTFNTALVGVSALDPGTPVLWAGLNSSFAWAALDESKFTGFLPGPIGPAAASNAASAVAVGPSVPASAANDAALAAGIKARPVAVGLPPIPVLSDGGNNGGGDDLEKSPTDCSLLRPRNPSRPG